MPNVNRVNALASDLCEISRLAHTANRLAHKLEGTSRDLALAMKDAACSLAILHGAIVNGHQTNDIIGLQFPKFPSSRIHARLSRLHPDARAIARRLSPCAPAVSALAEFIDHDQLRAIRSLVERRKK